MTAVRMEVRRFLSEVKSTVETKRLLKRTLQEFVIEYGWWYEPVKVPNGIVMGTPTRCFKNSFDLILEPGSPLIYCEGYALDQIESQPMRHAWVTDGKGNAIDNTWKSQGLAYVGIPFKTDFVVETAMARGGMISLINDWGNHFSLINDLGDQPEKWLELAGRGTKQVGTID